MENWYRSLTQDTQCVSSLLRATSTYGTWVYATAIRSGMHYGLIFATAIRSGTHYGLRYTTAIRSGTHYGLR